MPEPTISVSIRFSVDNYARLKKAAETGKSMNQLVNEAVEKTYKGAGK